MIVAAAAAVVVVTVYTQRNEHVCTSTAALYVQKFLRWPIYAYIWHNLLDNIAFSMIWERRETHIRHTAHTTQTK